MRVVLRHLHHENPMTSTAHSSPCYFTSCSVIAVGLSNTSAISHYKPIGDNYNSHFLPYTSDHKEMTTTRTELTK